MKFVYTKKQSGFYTSEEDDRLIQEAMTLFCIKVDGITLHDYTHFKDYRRGSGNFDFLTIPFAKGIEIGFLNDYELRHNLVEGDIASVVVWQDKD